MRVAEAEFCFRMGADIAPREFDPAARGTVADLLRERHVVLGSEFGP